MNTEESNLFYAFTVIPVQDLERFKDMIENSCETCGHPFLRAGHMCPKCIEALDKLIPVIAETFKDYLHPRWIHSSTHGFIDPWSREGRRLLDD